MRKLSKFLLCLLSLLLVACEENRNIVSGIDEREANIIIVFLDSKGIKATKQEMPTAPGASAGEGNTTLFSINVDPKNAISAMAILNSNGLPRRQGINLLDLFAKQSLMTTDKEETIRYQAGLAQQITNMILMIDGVIDAQVQISFPEATTGAPEEAMKQKVTAAVFVKHQGIVDDPNSHLENKIRRLVSGSIQGLDVNDVTIVSDRSRFTDITASSLDTMGEKINKEYVKIWSMVMNKDSASKFRLLFVLLLTALLLFALSIAFIIWKIYPLIQQRGGLKNFFKLTPLSQKEAHHDESP
jgi:type III secretion protein J